MEKERPLKTHRDVSERAMRKAQTRMGDGAAEDRAIDAAVKRSIKLHGP